MENIKQRRDVYRIVDVRRTSQFGDVSDTVELICARGMFDAAPRRCIQITSRNEHLYPIALCLVSNDVLTIREEYRCGRWMIVNLNVDFELDKNF